MQGKSTNKKLMMILGALAVLVLIYWLWSSSHSSPGGMESGMEGAVPVTTIRVQKERIAMQEALPGRIVPYQVAEIRPQVTGIITERLFEEGSEVTEGQQLYRIDPATYQAAYNSAKADIAKAEANVKSLQAKANRYSELVKIEAVSKQDYDDITAQLAQAKAEVGIAKAALETASIYLNYTKVYAPISGRIGKSDVTKGALVTANQPSAIARITQLDPIYVDLTLSSALLAQIRPTLQHKKEIPVTLFLEQKGIPYDHEGKLQFTDITVDPTTGSVMLRTLFPNPERELLPGLFIRAQIQLEAAKAILVPQQAAIHTPDGKLSVWRVDSENKVTPQPITIERTMGDHWLVTDGIEDGDTIVLEGFQKLAPGATVIVTPVESTNKKIADQSTDKEKH